LFKEKREDNMFAAIDIGNTYTVIGIYEDEILKTDLRIPSIPQKTEDEISRQKRST